MTLAIWFLLLILAKTKAENELPIDDVWIDELLNTENSACQDFLMDYTALSGTDACLDQPCDAPKELCSLPGDFMDVEPESPEERDEIIDTATCEPVPPDCVQAVEEKTLTTKKPDATKPEQTTKKTDVTTTIKPEDGTQAGKTTATQTTTATTPKPSVVEAVIGDPSTGVVGSGPNWGDRHFRCCEWARSGQCETNPFWMKVNCQESCGTPGCTVDIAPACKRAVSLKCQMQQQQQQFGFGQQRPQVMPQPQQLGQQQPQYGQQQPRYGQQQQQQPRYGQQQQQQPRYGQQQQQQPRYGQQQPRYGQHHVGFGQEQQYNQQQRRFSQQQQQYGQQKQRYSQQQ